MFFSKMKIIQDCIHGHILIPKLCLKFIDVPEFQRLRRIRQLGLTHYVYPSATHTRFEHSIGVMHLAGKMVDKLRKYKEISNELKELIQLGALYHDIGHSAYSHLFDKFLEEKQIKTGIFQYHHHEERSKIFLRKINDRLKLLTEEQVQFVERVIDGEIPEGEPAYLYEIVANKKCGVDVDKLDYLERDSYHTGMPSFKSDYIILCAGIHEDHVAFERKAQRELDKMFQHRHYMFQTVYLHKTCLKVERYYYCLMKRLGDKLFSLGDLIDDYSVETMIRSDPELSKVILNLDSRILIHECEDCQDYQMEKVVKNSGSIDQVKFF